VTERPTAPRATGPQALRAGDSMGAARSVVMPDAPGDARAPAGGVAPRVDSGRALR